MFCIACGANNPEEARFCNQCGKPVSTTSVQDSVASDGGVGSGSEAPAASSTPVDKERATALIQVEIRNKRYQQAEYEGYIWWDAVYEPVGLTKPTRAIKGVLEFADLFGEVHFLLKVVINDPMQPGKALATPGIGFKFNQFMGDHKWMHATDISNMKVRFRTQSIIYADGRAESV
jgi:hypothetical protein